MKWRTSYYILYHPQSIAFFACESPQPVARVLVVPESCATAVILIINLPQFVKSCQTPSRTAVGNHGSGHRGWGNWVNYADRRHGTGHISPTGNLIVLLFPPRPNHYHILPPFSARVWWIVWLCRVVVCLLGVGQTAGYVPII